MSKPLNNPLEMLCVLIEIKNANETISKGTWARAKEIVLKQKEELQNTNINLTPDR